MVTKIALARINLTTPRKAFQLGGYISVKILLAEKKSQREKREKKNKIIVFLFFIICLEICIIN